MLKTLRLSLVLVLGLTLLSILPSCGDDDPVGPDLDTVPPYVVSTVPADGDTGVPQTASLIITFSEELESSTISLTSVTGVPAIIGNVVYDHRTFMVFPTTPYNSSDDYTITISTAVTDTAGNHMDEEYSWTFTTVADTIAPTVSSTDPSDGIQSAPLDDPITITFSEAMDSSTVVGSTFQITPSVSFSSSYSGRTLTITPDVPLDSNETYAASITTAAYDTAGNAMNAPYAWSFSTFGDTTPPAASMLTPDNDVVVSDSVLLQAIATDAGGVDYVQFYVDGAAIADGADSSLPYQYVWDASDEDLGSVHTIHCVAYDNNGFSTSSDTVTVHYLWRELITDGQELAISRNLEAVYARSSDTLLEFRVKVYDGWNHYTAGDTSGIDCAFFLDTDQNRFTGRDSLGGVISINDIGADYRIVIGYHGDSLTHWSTTGTTIDSGLVDYLIAPDSSNYFEVGVLLSRLGNPSAFDLVVANYTLYKDPLIPADPGTFKFDWAPDQGLGHATYTVDHSWESVSAYRVEGHRLLEAQARPRLTENPFR